MVVVTIVVADTGIERSNNQLIYTKITRDETTVDRLPGMPQKNAVIPSFLLNVI
jgi:hypothetical protein